MKAAVSVLAIGSMLALAALLVTSTPDEGTSGQYAELAAVGASSSPPPAPPRQKVEARVEAVDDERPEAPAAAPAPAPRQSPPQPEIESEQLRAAEDQLAQMQLQVAAEESQRREEQTEEAAQHAATIESLDVLREAEASLATGDSDGIDEELVRAEEALSGRTRLDVEAAREALAREDLLPAREMLAAALAENRVRR